MTFEVATREAQKLSGMIWEGSYEAAASGHVKKTIAEMERVRKRLAGEQGGVADGDVFARYRRMFTWIGENGFERVTEIMHHREEYPAGLDLEAPPQLRLMTPIA